MNTEKQQEQYIKMTTEPVGKLLATLSIPTILGMMVTTIYNMVDTAFVGTLGTSESGATGIVLGYMMLLQAISFMCGQGGGNNMSRKLGAKDLTEATKYTSTSFFMAFTLAVVSSVFILIFMTPFVYMLGSTPTIEPYAKIYVFYIVISAPFFVCTLCMNNLLRYEGKAKLGTIGTMTGAVLNIFGDALFMFVFKMGIAGAGLSTAISQLISFLILIYMFLSGKTQTKISIKYVSLSFHTIGEIIGTGFPSLIRQGLNTVATMLLNRCSAPYGDQAVAAMSIVGRVSFFPMSIALGIGQGYQPIGGFNYGAGKKDRVRSAITKAIIGSEIVLISTSVLIFILSPYIIQVMRNDPEVIEIGARALRLMCVGQIFVPLTMMVEMGFQSIGDKLYASLGSSMRSGLIFIPTLLILSSTRGLSGIQEAQPLSFLISCFISIYLCKVLIARIMD